MLKPHNSAQQTQCFCSHLTPLQNAGANRNVCHQIPVKCNGDENVSINVENEDTFSPLLTSMRTLHSWESVAGDFAKKETVSTILEQLHSKDKRLNEVEIRTVIKSVEKFSGLEHSVEADDPFTGEVRVHKVTVDVDSVSATFQRRSASTDKQKDAAGIIQMIETTFRDDANFSMNTTSFKPNVKSLKQIPTEIKKYGPTFERSKEGYLRIKLPTPKP